MSLLFLIACIPVQFPKLVKPDKILLSPGRVRLNTIGSFQAELQVNNRKTSQTVYVVKDLQQPLLGRPAIKQLGVLAELLEVLTATEDPRSLYPKLFTRLGCIKDEFYIVLQPDPTPYSVSTPRRVPIPLLPQVKEELKRMVDLGVIERVSEPTQWCAPMTTAWKKRWPTTHLCQS